MTDALVTFRAPCKEDEPFIFDSWIKSYWKSGPWMLQVPFHLFHKGQHAAIEVLLPKCSVSLAVSPEDEGQIIGWLCREGAGTVHYCYVKGPFRRFGVGRQLLEHSFGQAWEHVQFEAKHAVLTYSHRTDVCTRLPIPEGWVYDPFQR